MGTTFTPEHRGGSGSPLVLIHGFTATWRAWDLVLAMLERHHDVFAPTLAGHAGGPPLPGSLHAGSLADDLERRLDAAGIETAHLVGNSLGGYLALDLAARGRARTVVALAPAGGWAPGDRSFRTTLSLNVMLANLVRTAAPMAEAIASTAEGRRQATAYLVSDAGQLTAELVAGIIRGAAGCTATMALVELARRTGWPLEPERITCPVRVVWGTEDRLLPWPGAAAGFRERWLAHADWVELQGVGHCPQLEVPRQTAELILGMTAPGRIPGAAPVGR